jgi:hypothetical protein
MLGEFEVLLTDEFDDFAAEIAKIHVAKKAKTAEFKAAHEKFRKEIADMDAEAKKLYDEWQASVGKKSTAQMPAPVQKKA